MHAFFRRIAEHFIPSPSNTFRPYLLRKQWLLFFMSIVLTAEGVFVAGFMARQTPQGTLGAAVLPGEIIAFTNVERVRESEPLLKENTLLDAAAQAKANDMAAKGYFSHTGPGGKEPWAWIQEAAYEYRYAGENLAVRFDDSINVVNAWMASPTHRANIVKGVYTEIGVGVAKGTYEGAPATFVVQYFGTPPTAGQPATASGDVSAAAVAPEPAVAGAQTAITVSAPTSTYQQEQPQVPQHAPQSESVVRQAGQALADSAESSSWVLGGVLLFVLLALALAFFIHIEIQSHELLLGGALVAGVAALFLALNLHLPSAFGPEQNAAAVTTVRHSVLVGEDASATQTPPTVVSE